MPKRFTKGAVDIMLITGAVCFVIGQIISFLTLWNLYGKVGQAQKPVGSLALQDFFAHVGTSFIVIGIALVLLSLALLVLKKIKKRKTK